MTTPYDLPRLEAAAGALVSLRETTSSTQDDAKAAAERGAPSGSVFVSLAQTAGRGRHGRSWSTAPGSAILASVVLRPTAPVESLPRLALVVGLALAESLERLVDGVGIKWPNDVLIHGRKVSGVLVEGVFRGGTLGAVIAGFGVNIRRNAVPPELAVRATSLEAEGLTELDPTPVLAEVLRRVRERTSTFGQTSWNDALPALRARDALLGRRVHGQDVTGLAAGIGDDGGLLVDVGSSLVTVQAGEVTLL